MPLIAPLGERGDRTFRSVVTPAALVSGPIVLAPFAFNGRYSFREREVPSALVAAHYAEAGGAVQARSPQGRRSRGLDGDTGLSTLFSRGPAGESTASLSTAGSYSAGWGAAPRSGVRHSARSETAIPASRHPGPAPGAVPMSSPGRLSRSWVGRLPA